MNFIDYYDNNFNDTVLSCSTIRSVKTVLDITQENNDDDVIDEILWSFDYH